ncbi:GAF domain-containing protein [Flavobacterium sp. Sd200]|uniref:sigma-54-dependent Fis family transcriptional regulator n=1 Tax=Flavobacterium sp. Sd200 TaxID=2692211 RepID=UPI00136BED2C|nr:sigma 54-interacting transcriptional regulator [Flavobacterium sp. Sd200]MXN90547.1 GAF domain-containing protein [Flavobacterium sp. Sd200]
MQQKNPQADAILKAIQEREKDHLLQLTICNALSQVTDVKTLQAVIKKVSENIECESFAICVSNSEEKEYFVFFQDGLSVSSELAEKKYNVSDGLFGTALHSADPVVQNLSNLNYKKGNLPAFIETAYNSGIKQMVTIPLHYQPNNPTVVFAFYKRPDSFTRAALRLLKGISMQLALTVTNIIVTQQIQEHLKTLKANEKLSPDVQVVNETPDLEVINRDGLSGIIGRGEAMQKVLSLVQQVAPSHSGVLLLGESGTGKEVIATAIHNNSFCRDKKMIRVNCAAIPANLIESELFGHEKGSFTGATERRIGKFEQANNSTLFLDEVGELPLILQTKLLRVLQENEFERIGSTTTIKVNVRIIAATNLNLAQQVEKGSFRADLFYRLNIFPIELPALRERKEDIETLSSYFIDSFCSKSGRKNMTLSPKVLRAMMVYTWPGNVRELKNTLERSILLTKGKTITEMAFPKTSSILNSTDSDHYIKKLEEVEKEHILKVVKMCNGRISGPNGAAIKLGLPSTTLISKMQKLGIQKGHAFRHDT